MELQAYFRAILFMYRSLNPVLDRAQKMDSNIKSDTSYVKSLTLKEGAETVVLLVNISPDIPANISVPAPTAKAENFFDAAWTFPIANGKCSMLLKTNRLQ